MGAHINHSKVPSGPHTPYVVTKIWAPSVVDEAVVDDLGAVSKRRKSASYNEDYGGFKMSYNSSL